MQDFKGKYYIYTRCSTEQQRKRGFSHEYQEKGLISHLGNCTGLESLGKFSDTISGTQFDDRPQLNILYNILKNNRGHANYIFVQKWDRFGRNTEECHRWLRMFKEIGVEINSPIEYVDFSGTNWVMQLSLIFAMAETESLKISDRTKDGLAQANRQGYYTASAPVGYKRVESGVTNNGGKKRKVLVQGDKAILIKEILLKYTEGRSRAELWKIYKDKLGIGRTTFYNIFTNVVYAGKVFCKAYKKFPEVLVNGKHEGIIGYETFLKIADLINSESDPNRAKSWSKISSTNDEFYLKGSIRCDLTNKVMAAGYSTGRNKKYPYYQVPSGKNRKSIKKEIAHKIFIESVSKLESNFSENHFKQLNEYLKDLTSDQRKIRDEAKKEHSKCIKRISKAENEYLNGDLEASLYNNLYSKLVASKAKSEIDIVNAESKIIKLPVVNIKTFDSLCNLSVIYRNAQPKLKREITRCLFPDGFSIDVERNTLQTARLNRLYKVNDSYTGNYKVIELKNGTNLSTCPALGERPDSNRRPSEPQTDALTN